MPTKRHRIAPRQIRHAAAMPIGAAWWLEHGRSLSIAEAEAVGLDARAAWQASCLHYDRPVVPGATFWSRKDCRAAGFGAQIDEFIRQGRAPHDDWRTSAQMVPLRT